MDKKLIGLILTLAVGVIMTGALLAPVVSSYGDETSIYYNEGMPFAEVDDDEHTIIVTSSAITVDGEEIDQSLFPGTFTQYTIVYGSDGFIRYDISNEYVGFRSTSATATDYYYSNGETVTVSINGATATVSSTDATLTAQTLSTATHYIASEGTFTMALNPVVASDSEIYGAGQTSFTSSTLPANLYTYVSWSGTIEGISSTLLYFVPSASYSTVTIDDTTINTTALGNGLYRIDSVLIDYTATDTDSNEYELTSTYTYFLAPAEIVYDNPNYIGFGTSGLMAAVVVVILVAMIAAAAAAANRDGDL